MFISHDLNVVQFVSDRILVMYLGQVVEVGPVEAIYSAPKRRLHAYPHELSGGWRQRAMIAMALSCRPSLLLADEPTTALDATVQIQVLTLLRQLREELDMGIIFVTHDIGVAAEIADRVAVMYAGRIVEQGRVRDVLCHPFHPYAEGMLSSSVSQQPRGARIGAIPGPPPDLRRLPSGSSFAPRCGYVTGACTTAVPEARRFQDGRMPGVFMSLDETSFVTKFQ